MKLWCNILLLFNASLFFLLDVEKFQVLYFQLFRKMTDIHDKLLPDIKLKLLTGRQSCLVFFLFLQIQTVTVIFILRFIILRFTLFTMKRWLWNLALWARFKKVEVGSRKKEEKNFSPIQFYFRKEKTERHHAAAISSLIQECRGSFYLFRAVFFPLKIWNGFVLFCHFFPPKNEQVIRNCHFLIQ